MDVDTSAPSDSDLMSYPGSSVLVTSPFVGADTMRGIREYARAYLAFEGDCMIYHFVHEPELVSESQIKSL